MTVRTQADLASDLPTPRRLVALDGIRGVAVLLVTMLHMASSDKFWLLKHVASIGWIGVDLFFALSGFLITRILFWTNEAPNFFLSFYARRALRIWPLYYLVLAFAFVGTHALPPGLQITREIAPYYATFTQNLFRPTQFGPWAIAGTWSLAIEEQFYLIWPLCVRRLSKAHLVRLLIAIVVLTPVCRCVALIAGVTPCTVYLSSFLRVDALAAGALAASFFDADSCLIALRFSRTLGLGFLCIGLALCIAVAGHDAMTAPDAVGLPAAAVIALTYSFLAVGFASLVFVVAADDAATLSRLLRAKPLQFFGRLSYGLYLIQGIVLPLAETFVRPWAMIRLHVHGVALTALVVFVAAAANLGIAFVTWRAVERPALRLADRFAAKRPALSNVLGGPAASVGGP